jgi:hypothetical protein
MKVPVRILNRPFRGNAVGATVNVSRGESRVLVSTNRAELVDAAAPAEAKQDLTQAVAKTVTKRAAKAPAKKAPAKKVAKKATKSIRGTRNASMAGKTATK